MFGHDFKIRNNIHPLTVPKVRIFGLHNIPDIIQWTIALGSKYLLTREKC